MHTPSKTKKLTPPHTPKGLPAIFEGQMQFQERRAYLMKAASREKCMQTIGGMALAAGGIAFTAFSALMQFSPQFALLVGLNLSPIALISVAAIGVLLLSVGLYQAHKARTTSPVTAPVVVKPVSAMQDNPSFCFKLFGCSTTRISAAMCYSAASSATPK